ncbi:GxxExxY protein [bacterium]|nr:GxxExxY protein [bacterium]
MKYTDYTDSTERVDAANGTTNDGELLYRELTFEIRAALFEVYNTLGPGFREETYRRAVLRELKLRGLCAEPELFAEVRYKGSVIDRYRMDIVVESKVVIELKAVEEMKASFAAQLLSYLKASQLRLGLLVNFGSDELYVRRFIR